MQVSVSAGATGRENECGPIFQAGICVPVLCPVSLLPTGGEYEMPVHHVYLDGLSRAGEGAAAVGAAGVSGLVPRAMARGLRRRSGCMLVVSLCIVSGIHWNARRVGTCEGVLCHATVQHQMPQVAG